MGDEFVMTLCNISGAEVTWKVKPVGEESSEVVQSSRQYGSISVPFAESYLVSCGEAQATANSPSVAAVFTGSEIVICTPA